MKMGWICADSLITFSMKKRHIRSGEDRQSSPPGHKQQDKRKRRQKEHSFRLDCVSVLWGYGHGILRNIHPCMFIYQAGLAFLCLLKCAAQDYSIVFRRDVRGPM